MKYAIYTTILKSLQTICQNDVSLEESLPGYFEHKVSF